MISREPIDYVELAYGEARERSAAFYLRRMAGDTMPQPFDDPPHRHNFQELLIIESGSFRHTIDGQRFEQPPPAVFLIARGQVHVVEGGDDLTGWIVRFTDDFLPAGLISPSWNYHTTLFSQLGARQALALTPADLRELRPVLDLLEAEYAAPAALQRDSALRHLLSALIIRVERIHQRAMRADQHQQEEYRIYQEFMALLERSFASRHDVQHYAGALGIAPARLSRILGRIVGKSTKQLIDERIVLEARRYLQFTDLPIKEIAQALGYSDLFHFSKTFKRLTGTAPQAFREQQQKLT
ncbi:MAG: helix-turn-helix transcriptional regulator [Chloroflexota bacterium]